MKYEISTTKQFEKDVKILKSRGVDISTLKKHIIDLSNDVNLPAECRDHPLIGDWKGYREFHVDGAGDWVVIYKKEKQVLKLILTRTGRHRDVFKKY